MSILSAIFYGLIQGLTEFLPVSSSGHLAIAHSLFGTSAGSDNFTFDILLHLATLIAVFIVYYKDIFPLVPAFFRMVGKMFKGNFKIGSYDKNERLALLVIIATIPLAIAVLINDKVELLSAYPKVVGGVLIFNGVVLFLSDLITKSTVDIKNATPLHALTVGICQLCAIVPGLSRSGSTITGGRLCGFSREFAVKFSFILSIPAIIGANIFNIPDVIKDPPPVSDIPAYLVGMAVAAVTGVLAMKLLTYISKKSNFRIFSVYCVAVGIIAVIFA